MSMKRRVHSREFKQEAVRLSQSSDKSIVHIEDDLGIPRGMLNKWKRQQSQEGGAAFRGQGQRTSEAAELHQLRQENELLRQEREILKKALAIFTRNPR